MATQFSVRTLLFVITCFAIAACFLPRQSVVPPDPEWRKHFGSKKPLENIPTVKVNKNQSKITRVHITNLGTTTLQYVSSVPGGISQYIEVEINNEWRAADGPWCPMGQKWYEIRPNETVELGVKFMHDNYRERLLGSFHEKNTDRSGMVVIATEPE